MVNMIVNNDNKKLIIFGLSRGNINKLVLGLPILITGLELGTKGFDFAITFGETESDIEKYLRETFIKVD